MSCPYPAAAGVTQRGGNTTRPRRVVGGMQLELTDDAAALLSKRGRTLVIDLIRPTG